MTNLRYLYRYNHYREEGTKIGKGDLIQISYDRYTQSSSTDNNLTLFTYTNVHFFSVIVRKI